MKKQKTILTGIIHIHPRGFGFFTPATGSKISSEIFIPKQSTRYAVDGDCVEVELSPLSTESNLEGKVVAIIERTRSHLAGTIVIQDKEGVFFAYCPLLGKEERVKVLGEGALSLTIGDRVILSVVQWGEPEKKRGTTASVSARIGHIDDVSSDLQAILQEHDIRADFPLEVVEEAERWKQHDLTQDAKGRLDLRSLDSITIDPETAKDFDDALSLQIDAKGFYKVGVHIADVSHFIPKGSLLDKEAKRRSNSCYFSGFSVPMVPSFLSEELCSLKPNKDRFTVSLLMTVNPSGEVVDYNLVRSVIHSKARLTYEEARHILKGEKKSPHRDLLHHLSQVAHLLKQDRLRRGSIEFAIPDQVLELDSQGNPIAIKLEPYDLAHQLVEELMLKANEIVALHLSQKGISLPYRVHGEPFPEDMNDFIQSARSFGFKLPEEVTPELLQKFFDEALATPLGKFIAINYIRSLPLAQYSAENIGHYGLGLTHYCHFTSPIRRYIDLTIHRLLFESPIDIAELEVIASESTQIERWAQRAERTFNLLKKLRLLSHLVQSQSRFKAIVTRVRKNGIEFELLDFYIEGFIPIAELGNDYYRFQDSNLIGKSTKEHFYPGKKIEVIPTEINLIFLEAKWRLL